MREVVRRGGGRNRGKIERIRGRGKADREGNGSGKRIERKKCEECRKRAIEERKWKRREGNERAS